MAPQAGRPQGIRILQLACLHMPKFPVVDSGRAGREAEDLETKANGSLNRFYSQKLNTHIFCRSARNVSDGSAGRKAAGDTHPAASMPAHAKVPMFPKPS